jgi:hypothetical protein
MDNLDDFCFIIIRHVNSLITNEYWNHNVKLLRSFYPEIQIIIIDDNSDDNFLKSNFEYKNLRIIKSEYNRRGELLPYYYFLKYKFAKNAVIIHDSTFIHKRIKFENLKNINVLPLWHFNKDNENIENIKRIIKYLNYNYFLEDNLEVNDPIIKLYNINKKNIWYGCFGCQSIINYNFLYNIDKKYNLSNLINVINCRADRCCLERILGCIFFIENPKIIIRKSLLGNIFNYQKWGETYQDYKNKFDKKIIEKGVIKVWTGR